MKGQEKLARRLLADRYMPILRSKPGKHYRRKHGLKFHTPRRTATR